MFGRETFSNLFSRDETKFKTTKITRKFDADGKVVEETTETTEHAASPEEHAKIKEDAAKEGKKVDDFFATMNTAFNKLWGK